MKIKAALLLLCLGTTAVSQDSPEWMVGLRQTKILISNRQEVEKVFKSPKIVRETNRSIVEKNGWSLAVEYETMWGDLEAEYSTGNCAESKSIFGYDVPKGLLTRLTFWPDQLLSPESLSFEVANMERDMTDDVDGVVTYYHYASGLRLGVTNGKVKLIEYFPMKEQENLSCEKLRKK